MHLRVKECLNLFRLLTQMCVGPEKLSPWLKLSSVNTRPVATSIRNLKQLSTATLPRGKMYSRGC